MPATKMSVQWLRPCCVTVCCSTMGPSWKLTPDLIVARLLEQVPAQDKPLPTSLKAAKI